jgi:hypothetical protein
MRKALIGIVVVILVGLAMLYFSDDHQRFLAFKEQRDAWHRKCDLYVGTTAVASPEAIACKRELDEMTAYAKRQGWDR